MTSHICRRHLLGFVTILVIVSLAMFFAKSRIARTADKVCPDESLHEIAYYGEESQLETVYDENPQEIRNLRSIFQSEPPKRFTPLMWAAVGQQRGAIRKLLRLGADIDQVDQFGQTALYLAVSKGLSSSVDELLAAGANPNICTTFVSSPLLEAICRSDFQMASKLIAHGADPNAPIGKSNAVFQAVVMGQAAGLRWLFWSGARIDGATATDAESLRQSMLRICDEHSEPCRSEMRETILAAPIRVHH